MAFLLSVHPWTYIAKYSNEKGWAGQYSEKKHFTPAEEASLPQQEHEALMQERNFFPGFPLVNYTTQYAVGCFEGIKAFPQPDNTLKIFRPDKNAERMYNSMEGLMMPPLPLEHFMQGISGTVMRNYKEGFFPRYDKEWEKSDFIGGHAVYIRPFTYSEGGIGLNLSVFPWFIVVCTNVSSYFQNMEHANAVTTDKVRATRGGTGWIKCASNYVIPILEKKRVEKEGFMEVIFLDAEQQCYVEEGSSCNIFFYLKNGTLVTPPLEDRILPGITRSSIITLARSLDVPVKEQKISIDEVLSNAQETFVTGTAAGVTQIASIQHKDYCAVFNNGKIGELTHTLQCKLKHIQYGLIEDKHQWMFPVSVSKP